MENKKLMLLGFYLVMAGLVSLLLLTLPLVNAAEEELSFEPNETIDLKIFCFDVDSELCKSTTRCEISIFFPNMSVYYTNESMTNLGNYFNYSANRSSTLGVYKAMATCTEATTAGYSNFDFYVGRPSTDAQSRTTILAVSILFGVAVLFFLGFLFIKKDVFKWSFFLFAILFMVVSINIVSISLRNEAGSENIRNIFDTIGAVSYYMYWLVFGLIITLWMFSIILTIGDKWTMRQAQRVGQPIDFDKRY